MSDAFPICFATKDPYKTIQAVKQLEPTFGARDLLPLTLASKRSPPAIIEQSRATRDLIFFISRVGSRRETSKFMGKCVESGLPREGVERQYRENSWKDRKGSSLLQPGGAGAFLGSKVVMLE